MTREDPTEHLFLDVCRAEDAFHATRWRFLESAVDPLPVLTGALTTRGRGTALRTLQLMPEAMVRSALPALVAAASVADSEILEARTVIRRFDREWLEANLWSAVEPVLAAGSYEEWLRMAELIAELDPRSLGRLVALARANPDPEVRDVADEFEGRV